MKSLVEHIIEGLRINKSNKKSINNINNIESLTTNQKEKIQDELCVFFQWSIEYDGKIYPNKLEVLQKYFNNNIVDFLNSVDSPHIDILFKALTNRENIDKDTALLYIEDNNDELYNIIKDFVL